MSNDETLKFWKFDIENKTYENYKTFSKMDISRDHNSLIKINKEKVLIGSGNEGILKIINIKNLQFETRIFSHRGHINSFLILDDRTLITSGDDYKLKQWDIKSLNQIGVYDALKLNWFEAMIQLPDQNGKKRIAAASLEKILFILEY